MKKLFIPVGLISSMLLFSSCGEAEKTEVKNEDSTKVVVEAIPCMLTLDNESVVVNWTSFKLSDKVAVGGTFDSIAVTGVIASETMIETASTALFQIFCSSVNTNNPERDVKIANNFFGVMNYTNSINGRIVSLNEEGTGIVAIEMNGIENEVDVKWEATSESRLKLSTSINILDWNAQPSLDSLNGVCSLLHTGEDGTSVLWPDVEIEVFADFKSDCE